MTTKAPGPDETLDLSQNPSSVPGSVLAAWASLTRLKTLYRQGWLHHGVDPAQGESVADHSFGTAILGLLLAAGPAGGFSFGGQSLDPGKIAVLALVHELGEAYAGDLTPGDGVAKAEKRRLEEEGLDRALAGFGGKDWLKAAWLDYEEGQSPEARFVRQVDKLEMGLQAAVYRSQGGLGMEEFFGSAKEGLGDRALGAVLEAAIASSVPKPSSGVR